MKYFKNHKPRMKAFKFLAVATIILNVMQLIVGLFRETLTTKTIREAIETDGYFSSLLFEKYCLIQKTNLLEYSLETRLDAAGKEIINDSVIVGIFPMFLAETAVMFLVLLFSLCILHFTRHAIVSKFNMKFGLILALALLMVDQTRYFFTSIFQTDKHLFTWSSYCMHGDIGWFFDALAYVALYGAIALCVASFAASYMKLRPSTLYIDRDHFGQKEAFVAVESTFSWLAYFGYAFLVIWVVFSGITPHASKAYATQGIIIFLVIFAFYFAVIYRYMRITFWHQNSLSVEKAENPVTGYLAPHGTKAVQTFIKLALPIIFFLSVWFEWIGKLLTLSAA